MSIRTVVTTGYGQGGSIGAVVLRGYFPEAATATDDRGDAVFDRGGRDPSRRNRRRELSRARNESQKRIEYARRPTPPAQSETEVKRKVTVAAIAEAVSAFPDEIAVEAARIVPQYLFVEPAQDRERNFARLVEAVAAFLAQQQLAAALLAEEEAIVLLLAA